MSNSKGNRLAEESLNNNYIKENNQGSTEDSVPPVSGELTQLRSLLLGIEEQKLHRFYDKLDNPQVDAQDISRMLPEAVRMRTMQDEQLSEAMVPTVEQAIQSSVNKDINVLSQAIYPIIAPATRKAIATALDEMIQSFNKALEHSVSVQSLKWRIEARQTGKSFAEVVLLRTMIYRVEQVLLIHKHTGLMLQHIVAPKVAAQDPSLVSAMLSAIQDFVRDSFNVPKHEGLHSLQFGELTIWIEEAPTCVLAGIIRGNAPEELRFVFQNAIEKIHLNLGKEISDFSGDTKPFAATKPYLKACLESHYRKPTKTKYIYAGVSVGILAMVLTVWGFFAARENKSTNSYIKSLSEQPGIVVTKIDRKNGKYFIEGIRDPLAIEPNKLMKQANINEKAVVHQWKPFISLEREIIAKRAAKFLEKPKTVTFNVDKNGILNATGSAPRQWILSTRERKPSLSLVGITGYDDKKLKDLDFEQLNAYKKEVEEVLILFQNDTTLFVPGEEEKLSRLVPKIQNLIDASKSLEKNVLIEIAGHTDTSGIEDANMKLSLARANRIFNYLIFQGIDKNNLSTKAFGSKNILRAELTEEDKKFNRRVSFKVMINDVAQ